MEHHPLDIAFVVAFGAALYFAFNRIEFGDAACGPAFASASAFCEPHVRPYRLAAIGLALALLDAGLVNKVSFFIAPTIIGGHEAPSAIGGGGAETMADALQLDDVEIEQHGRD